jgi:FkbM family methyltransferase
MKLRDQFTLHEDGRMISYAQCAEDVIISRFFEQKLVGTYIDVGANHPVSDSVTKNLYDAGWKGINIEPESNFFAELESSRVRDINLKMGLSSRDAEADYFQVDSNLDLSTFDRDRADFLRSKGHSITTHRVEIGTLRSVLRNHNLGEHIDMIKIDVEGHELEVLKGIDFDLVEFGLMIIEVGGAKEAICNFLNLRSYKLAYFDGLNAWFTLQDYSNEVLFQPPSPVLDWCHPHVYLNQIQQQHQIILNLMNTSG